MEYDDWADQEAMLGPFLIKSETIEDLDPNRSVTHLENGIPCCYLGHPECYDNHTSERLADEADWENDLDEART